MGTIGSRICELENGSNIYLGGLQATTEPYLVGADVTHVVNCCITLPHMKSVERKVLEMEKSGGLSVVRLNWKDERAQQLTGLDFAIRSVFYAAQKGRSVLIHCEQGKSRSGSVMIAYMMAAHNMSFQQALQFVRVSANDKSHNLYFENVSSITSICSTVHLVRNVVPLSDPIVVFINNL